MKSRKRYIPLGSRIFDILNITLMVLVCLTVLYPFWHILVVSLSSAQHANSLGLKLLPDGLNLQAYKVVFSNGTVLTAYFNTILRTVTGTALSTFFTMCGAFALAKRDLPLRSFLTGVLFVTMYFSGGLIPSYFLIRNLGLYDTFLVYIIPPMLSAYYIFIARNFVMSIPESLGESAAIDGANELTVLLRIILPLSMPIVATISLWMAVYHWNAWFDALVYTKSKNLIVLQLYMQRIIDTMTAGYNSSSFVSGAQQSAAIISQQNVISATCIVTIGPIVLAYPFAQKYLVKGIMIGSIKG